MIILIKAVIFDYAGVVGKESHENDVLKAISEEFGSKPSFRVVKDVYANRIETYGLTKRVSEKNVMQRFARHLGISDVKKLKSVWDMFYATKSKLDEKVVDIAKNLKKSGYHIAILSNVFEHRARILKRTGGYNNFKPVLLSCKIGMRKPDEKIYRYAVKRLNARPQECIFIDDREKNLVSAEKIGMKTILFKNAKQLEMDLKEYL